MNDILEKVKKFFLVGIYSLPSIFMFSFIFDDDFQQKAFLDTYYIPHFINLKTTKILFLIPILLLLNSIIISNKYFKVTENINYSNLQHRLNFILNIFFTYISMILHSYLYLLIYLFSSLFIAYFLVKDVRIKSLIVYSFLVVTFGIYLLANLGYIPKANFLLSNKILLEKPIEDENSKLYTRDLSNRDFVNAVFDSSTIIDVNFENCNLSGASFIGTELSDKTTGRIPHFKNTNLRNTNFAGATLFYADFSNAKFDSTDFTGSKFESCLFDNTDLRKCKGLSINQFQNISINNSHVPQFFLDSIESNPEKYKHLIYLIKNNNYYSKKIADILKSGKTIY